MCRWSGLAADSVNDGIRLEQSLASLSLPWVQSHASPRERLTTSPERFRNLGTEKDTERLSRGPLSVQLWSKTFDCLLHADMVVFPGIGTQVDTISSFRSQIDKDLEDKFKRSTK